MAEDQQNRGAIPDALDTAFDDETLRDVRRAAAAAHFRLEDDEERAMAARLQRMKALFATLDEVETDGVEPLVYGIDEPGDWRADEARPSLPQAEVLANAPSTEGGFFKVPRIVDSES